MRFVMLQVNRFIYVILSSFIFHCRKCKKPISIFIFLNHQRRMEIVVYAFNHVNIKDERARE